MAVVKRLTRIHYYIKALISLPILSILKNNIKTIIIPKANKKDVDDLPKEVKDNLHIIYKCINFASDKNNIFKITEAHTS